MGFGALYEVGMAQMSKLHFRESEAPHAAMANTPGAGTLGVGTDADTLPGGPICLVLVVLALVALVLASPRLFAQPVSKATRVNAKVAVLQLRLDHGDGPLPLYYSACCRARALETQQALEDQFASDARDGPASDGEP
jgi:hypothetical protein